MILLLLLSLCLILLKFVINVYNDVIKFLYFKYVSCLCLFETCQQDMHLWSPPDEIIFGKGFLTISDIS